MPRRRIAVLARHAAHALLAWLLLATLLPTTASAQSPTGSVNEQALNFMLRMARVVGRQPPGTVPQPGQEPTGEVGYGFIIGDHPTAQGRPGLLILTADHLVRDPAHPDARFAPVILTFYGDLAAQVPAEVLPQHLAPADGDLAVLLAPAPSFVRLPPVIAVDPQTLLPGMEALQIGRPGVWEPSQTPGRFSLRASSGWLTFEGLEVAHGTAGAPVLTGRGLAGMIVGPDPTYPGNARIVPADLIASKLQAWGLPWQIAAPAAPAAAAPAAPPSLSDITASNGQQTTVVAPGTPSPPPPVQTAANKPLPTLPPRVLQPITLLASELASRASWVPAGARLSPWDQVAAPLLSTPTPDGTRIGSMPPRAALPPDLWSRGAYQTLNKLDNGAWFLAGSEGQPVGYVAGNYVAEVWPTMDANAPPAGRVVRDWMVGDRHAQLRDAGNHFELTMPVTCKREFCDVIYVATPMPPHPGAIVPSLMTPAISGAWKQDEVTEIRLQLPRRVVEIKGTQLLACIGRFDDCTEQTLLPGPGG